MHYSKNDVKKSNEVFKAAIHKVDFAMGKDLEEALIVALKVNDETFAEEIVIKLLKGGIPLSYFQKDKEITALKGWQEIKNNYPAYQAYHKANFNANLRKAVFELRTIDSIATEKSIQFGEGKIDLTVNELIHDAKNVYNKWTAIVAQYGFPAEKKMGYYFKNGKISNYPGSCINIISRGKQVIKDDFTYESLVCMGYMSESEYNLMSQIGSLGRTEGIEETMKYNHKWVMDRR